MRFASLGGQSNYAQAGKAVADDAAKVFKVARENSPDFGELSQRAMIQKGKENVAQGNNETRVKVNDNKLKQEGIVAGSRRKAGVVAAMGKAGLGLAGAFMGKEKKSDYSSYDAKIKASRDKAAELRAQSDAINTEFKPATTPNTGGTASSPTSTTAASGTPGDGSGWARMSKVIKSGEGTLGDKGYTTQFTGTQFSDMSKHPAQIRSANGLSSDAAGAYQFLSTTYNPAAKALGITDFSAQSQEKVGKYLAQQRGMNTDIVHTDKASFLKSLDKIAPEWASMPTIKTGTSYYGQGGLTPDEAWSIYNS
jgi:muramidase (phage lysozyme)